MENIYEISMRLLMTGFEPFFGERINPSGELLKFFAHDPRVETLLLPVSYQRSVAALEAELQNNKYDFVLLCGQAGGRKHICFERVAINYIDADKADEDGKIFLETKIKPQGKAAYLSELPLRQWMTELRAKGFNVEISNSAGTFVCNHIYYRMLEHFQSNHPKTSVLFLHVPYLTEQLMGKPAETFGMSLEAMKQAIDALLALIESYV